MLSDILLDTQGAAHGGRGLENWRWAQGARGQGEFGGNNRSLRYLP